MNDEAELLPKQLVDAGDSHIRDSRETLERHDIRVTGERGDAYEVELPEELHIHSERYLYGPSLYDAKRHRNVMEIRTTGPEEEQILINLMDGWLLPRTMREQGHPVTDTKDSRGMLEFYGFQITGREGDCYRVIPPEGFEINDWGLSEGPGRKLDIWDRTVDGNQHRMYIAGGSRIHHFPRNQNYLKRDAFTGGVQIDTSIPQDPKYE